MTNKKELVLLFSGGIDSTYTVTLMQEEWNKIYLITYDRFGFLNTSNSKRSASDLKKRFGEEKFTHRIINIDKLFRKISYESYLKDVFRYKLFLLSTCGLCKLAMHWQTIIYCLENKVFNVCDGSNREMGTDPSQNEMILEEMKKLYKEFQINYFSPAFYDSREKREKTLFDLGLSPVQHPKWTRFSLERQPFCTQERLFLIFFEYAHTNLKGQYVNDKIYRYEKRLIEFHREKMNFIRKQIYRYIKKT